MNVLSLPDGRALRESPPVQLLLSPFLPRYGLSMLYGASGVGKTHAALGAAFAVANGGAFLGWKAAQPARVLYLEGEMDHRMFESRIGQLVRQFGQPEEGMFTYQHAGHCYDRNLSLSTEEGREAIYRLAAGAGATLLVIDHIGAFCAGEENIVKYWRDIRNWLWQMRNKTLSVLLVQQTGKGKCYRGTSYQIDLLDSVVHLRRPEGYRMQHGAWFRVEYEKLRHMAGKRTSGFEARLIEDAGQLWWEIPGERRNARIWQMHEDGMSCREIAEIEGLGKSTINRKINCMLHAKGMLEPDEYWVDEENQSAIAPLTDNALQQEILEEGGVLAMLGKMMENVDKQ